MLTEGWANLALSAFLTIGIYWYLLVMFMALLAFGLRILKRMLDRPMFPCAVS